MLEELIYAVCTLLPYISVSGVCVLGSGLRDGHGFRA